MDDYRFFRINLRKVENYIRNPVVIKEQETSAENSKDSVFRFFLEKIKEGAVSTDAAGIISYCNKGFAEIVNETLQRIIGENICNFIDPSKREFFNSLMNIEYNQNSDNEIEFISSSGERIITNICLYKTALKNDDEINIIITDLRDRKTAENTMEKARNELEAKVKERTKELYEINRMLRVEINERKKAKAEIEDALHEKDILLKEIHHRVKNNLQIITSLLNLQSSNVNQKNASDILLESKNRIKSMALIHERLYQGKNLSHIKFKSYISELIEYLYNSYNCSKKGISISFQPDDFYMNIDKAIVLGLIINEIITNSFKHAFKDIKNGFVEVKSFAGEEFINLYISDNGIGMPDSLDLINPDTLGLQLIFTLADQINASIKVDNQSGTKYFIEFRK